MSESVHGGRQRERERREGREMKGRLRIGAWNEGDDGNEGEAHSDDNEGREKMNKQARNRVEIANTDSREKSGKEMVESGKREENG